MNTPHGNKLVNLIAEPERTKDLQKLSKNLGSITLSNRQLSDLELLMNGAFSPLRGFMTREEYRSVRDTMRLQDGTLWPMPVCLDVSEAEAGNLKVGQSVALRDAEGFMVAVLTIEDIWPADKFLEAERVYGSRDERHPGVEYLLRRAGTHYVGGAGGGHTVSPALRVSPASAYACGNPVPLQKTGVAAHRGLPYA